ncbi:hypothetical protein AURANDRAFT_65188 [Aureococcus anophagefferens]|uniref:Uncharacterized protein n=1 Tax=Aureococcus anophagefferens TaxID=44056 RepID=F0YD08_AURAN|nr:hypothetical protein AURANDRAFT_65188 [Aureococcus anophagefferens]EGB07079.1 hypothetical protein AURANDRAFT_65188 [Aureococcus anophagefferens]|eukprot:XP_009038313.1 hypothetical protein AURANDRAFT_65188 [Aureococcus anophagefferens]
MATWAQGESVSVELPAGERWKPEHLDMSMGSMHISQDSFHETPREHAVPLADIKVFRPKLFAEDDEQALRDRADACGKRAADARVDAEAESEDRDAARLHRRRARVAAHDALECEAEAQASRRISVQSALMLERAKQAVEATRRHCTLVARAAVCDAAAAEARAKLLDDRDAAAAAAPPAAPPPAPPTLAAARLEKTLKELEAHARLEELDGRESADAARATREAALWRQEAELARAEARAANARLKAFLEEGGDDAASVRSGRSGSEPPAADPGLQYKLEAAHEEIAILKQRAEDARAEAEGYKRQHRQAEASAQVYCSLAPMMCSGPSFACVGIDDEDASVPLDASAADGDARTRAVRVKGLSWRDADY